MHNNDWGLENGESVTFIRTKGPQETQPLGFDKKFAQGDQDLAIFDNLPRGW